MFKLLAAVAVVSASVAACAPATTGPNLMDPNGPNQCRAQDWQSYVGKPRQSLPATPQGMTFRVLGPNSAATADYSSSRVTFVYDDRGVITRATCG